MLPLSTPDTLQQLIDAGAKYSFQLELALFRTGITAEVDLARLRILLEQPAVEVSCSRDENGERRLCFTSSGTLTGVLDHRGRFHHYTLVAPSEPVAADAASAASWPSAPSFWSD